MRSAGASAELSPATLGGVSILDLVKRTTAVNLPFAEASKQEEEGDEKDTKS
jgi:hypothetical protein